MTEPLSAGERMALLRSLTLGTRRQEPELPGRLVREGDLHPAITAMAFASQQARLSSLPPRIRGTVTTFRAPEDPRPLLPETLRPALARLVTAAIASRRDLLLEPVAWRIRDLGLRLHPFDDLAMRNKSFRTCLGPYEAWYLSRGRGHAVSASAASDDTWTSLGPQTRADWLRMRRAQDPQLARDLVAGQWGQERAEMRLAMLGALEVRLGPDDTPFLESLSSDRSGKVKDLAARFLRRLDVESERDTSVEALLRKSLVVKRSPLGKRRLELVSGVDITAVRDFLVDLHPADIGERLGIPVERLMAPAGDAPLLAGSFAVGALLRDDPSTFEAFAAANLGTRVDGDQALTGWWQALAHLGAQRRPYAAEHVFTDPVARVLPGRLEDAQAALEWLEGPMPLRASRAMRAGPAWAGILSQLPDAKLGDHARACLSMPACLIHPDDARDATRDLDAIGPMADPLVHQLWQLVAALNELQPSTRSVP